MSNIKHRLCDHRLYSIYSNMKTRYYNKNNHHYPNYGGRGIRICDEWLNNFVVFYNWAIDNGYSEGLSIDRIDVNGNYEPSNCRFITQHEQCYNTRRNVYITYDGKTQTMKQWSKELDICYQAIYERHKRGYSDIECLFGKNCVYKK